MTKTVRELIVDSFAGGGGASTGIERALGVSPDIAINHDAIALAMHQINHPKTLHLPHNIWKVDPTAVCKGQPVGLLWASPDCKHFSKAKGGKPVEKSIRDLAWVVVQWAKQVSPRVIMVENVEEFKTWGPLGIDNKPCPERKGQEFNRWIGELKRLGYKVDWRELRACDYGAPTIRKRLFLIARRDGLPIIWPKPTHGDPKLDAVKSGKLPPWRTAAEIIDWSLPCYSIFLTPEEAKPYRVKRPLAPATMARIAKGVKRYVIDAAEPFLARTAHGEQDKNGKKRGRGDHSLQEPFSTVLASPDHSLIVPHLNTNRNAQKPFNEANKPTHVITAGGAHLNLIVAHLTKLRKGNGGVGMDKPAPTVTANSFIDRPGGAAPIGLVAASLSTYYGKGDGGEVRGSAAGEPLRTQTTENRHALVAAFLAQYNNHSGTNPHAGRDLKEPASSITTEGPHQAVVAAEIVNLKGSDRRGSNPEAPAPTQTADGNHIAATAAFLTKQYGDGGQHQEADDPLHTATTKARFAAVSVSIRGEPYYIADIGMRMLTPRELFRAQGFPDSYIIDRGLLVGADIPFGEAVPEIAITKTDQVSKCGNSVCPPMAEALVKANFEPLEVNERGVPDFALRAAE